MKHLINKGPGSLLGFVLLSTLFISCSSEKQISSTYSKEEISPAINNSRWTFSAKSASPSYGDFRNLTGGYFVKCQGIH